MHSSKIKTEEFFKCFQETMSERQKIEIGRIKQL